MTVRVELFGLEVPGAHGVEEDERRSPQRFLYDLRLDLPEPASDSVDETVDYRDVVRCVQELSESREFRLLETMAAATADALLERFQLERVRVRVR